MDPLVLSGSKANLGDTLSRLRGYVTAAAREAGLEDMQMHRLRLAVDEIATNIIMYGYKHDHGVVTISSSFDGQDLIVLLEDRGVEFDPTQHAMPDADDLEAPLEDRDLGGLGIFLTIQGMDEFRYERIGDLNRNYFRLRRGSAQD